MKRWPTRIMICLLLGVVTTVAVAWGLAYLPDESRVTSQMLLRDPPGILTVSVQPGRVSIVLTRGLFPGSSPLRYDEELLEKLPRWSRLRNAQLDPQLRDYSAVAIYTDKATGWPTVALRRERMSVQIQPTPSSEIGDLPLMPILPGFLIDTFFYGVIWFALIFGIGATRRTIRRKRGRCIKCAYDLRGHRPPSPASGGGTGVGGEGDVVCPECGWGREEGTEGRRRERMKGEPNNRR